MRLGQVQMDFEYEKSFMTSRRRPTSGCLHDVMVEDPHPLHAGRRDRARLGDRRTLLERLPPDPYFAGSWGRSEPRNLLRRTSGTCAEGRAAAGRLLCLSRAGARFRLTLGVAAPQLGSGVSVTLSAGLMPLAASSPAFISTELT